jgi:hypothetical protein
MDRIYIHMPVFQVEYQRLRAQDSGSVLRARTSPAMQICALGQIRKYCALDDRGFSRVRGDHPGAFGRSTPVSTKAGFDVEKAIQTG